VQSALILAIIAVGAVGQGASIWRLIHDNLYVRHAAFFGFTLVALTRSIASIVSHGHLHPYLEVWHATQWPLALLGAAAAIEAFWRLALHFRNVRGFGFILLIGIIGVAAGSSWFVAALNSRWDGPLHGPLMFEESVECALTIVVLLSLAFFRMVPSIPIRPNSVRHVLILSFLYGTSFVGNFVGLASRGHGRFSANLIVTLGLAITYWSWTIKMNRSGESLPFPVPAMSTAEAMQALNDWDQRLYAEGNAIINDLDDASRLSNRRSSARQP
jgi:hypothetical protein